jgi:hypothetical protein
MGFGEKIKKGMGFFLMCFGISANQKKKPKPKVVEIKTAEQPK